MHATVLFSGGIDSASCAYLLQRQGYQVRGLYIDFGQAAMEREFEAATSVAQRLAIPLRKIRVASDRVFGSGEILGRNAFLICTALLCAAKEPSLIAIGIHAGTRYYDCSPVFFERMATLVQENSDGVVVLAAPFLNWSKRDVYEYFNETNIPSSETYSCETGGDPCLVCASCRDRARLHDL